MSGSDHAWTKPLLLVSGACVALVAAAVVVGHLSGGSAPDPAPHARTVDRPARQPRAPGPQAKANAPSPGAGGGRSRHPSSPYRPLPRVEPARFVADPDPLAPADVLQPIVNGWRAGDHRGLTIVEAGLAGDDPTRTKGRFVIFRERERPFSQAFDVVEVPGAGALRITRAPTGRRVAGSSQRHGNLGFAGTSGTTGTLHLKDDTVTLGSP